ncbi:PLC-like phosphodiesterase [Stipitochalara longipes BDJ]|nr:PLC-like phosphodiesterase [Stipitochalara longipes BDJ]
MAEKELDLSKWMKYLKGSVRVIDSYIPGSHDASAYEYSGGANWWHGKVGSIAQAGNYYAQLRAGQRYFDMRVERDPLEAGMVLRMHHGDFSNRFEAVDTVLQEIKKFADVHKGEFFFLDVDFVYGKDRSPELEQKLIETLEKELGGQQHFATAHVVQGGTRDGWYNTELTWDQLRADGKQFIIIWQSQIESGFYWAPNRDKILENPDGHFDQLQPDQIVAWLDESLREWKRGRLRITDLVNTPNHSWEHHPVDADREAQPMFEPWLLGKKPGNGVDPKGNGNLGIVRRDFVNKDYARKGTDHIIRMNQFSTGAAPEKTLGPAISYGEDILLYAPDGSHVFVDVKYAPEKSLVSVAFPDKVPVYDDVFLVQNYNPKAKVPLCYSGNVKADGATAHGGFRLVHHDTRTHNNVGDKVVLSVGTEQNLDDLDNTGQVYDGATVLIKSLNSLKWWQVTTDPTTKLVGVQATAKTTSDATLFTIKIKKY